MAAIAVSPQTTMNVGINDQSTVLLYRSANTFYCIVSTIYDRFMLVPVPSMRGVHISTW